MFFRFKVVTHKDVQFRLATAAMLWFLVFAAALAALFFFNYVHIAERTQDLNIHDELVTRMLLVQQAKELAFWYGGSIFVFMVLIWFYLTVYSHRLTGPIYKFEKMLEKCIHNKSLPERELKFRKTDAFHGMADLFNQFVETIRQEKNKRES